MPAVPCIYERTPSSGCVRRTYTHTHSEIVQYSYVTTVHTIRCYVRKHYVFCYPIERVNEEEIIEDYDRRDSRGLMHVSSPAVDGWHQVSWM